jgi:hypothetical protein
MKKIIAALLTTTVLSTSSLFAADESAAAVAQPAQTLRASIDRAVASAVATETSSASRADAANVSARGDFGQRLATPARAEHSEGQMAAGGGGGHAMAVVWTLVGSAVSVGATVYYMKYMRKTMADATAPK